MKNYIGTKLISACPQVMNGKDGYKVVYSDRYESWSPKEAFDEAYRETSAMNFGLALEAVIHKGLKAARKGWNGKDMFIFFVPGSRFAVSRPPLLGIYNHGTVINYHGHIDMKTVDGTIVPWLASQADMQADDWHLVEKAE